MNGNVKTTENKKTVKCTVAVMKKCKYGKAIASSIGYHYCDYLGMTGERRGCKPECCDKYDDGKKKK